MPRAFSVRADRDSVRLTGEELALTVGLFLRAPLAQDPRKHTRVAWNRQGEVSSLTGHFICACFVRDISPAGARLIVPSEVVPDYFRLNYGFEGLTPKCRVRWRDGNQMGVQFFGGK